MPDGLQYIVRDTAGEAPFHPGDRVMYRDDPARVGVMTVTDCHYRYGCWIVSWAQEGYPGTRNVAGHAPADHLVAMPRVIGDLTGVLKREAVKARDEP